jgi:nitroreductase
MSGSPPPPAPIPPGSALTVRELIDRRYSCRTYLPEPIPDDTRRRLIDYMAAMTTGPFGSQARFGLIAASPGDRDALKRLGTYGFIKGATGFIVGAVGKAPKDHEDYGYLLEQVILRATGLGLGTCWLGGTFTRSTFVRRFGGLRRGETMPAVVSIGLIGDDGTERIREREEGSRRLRNDELFFEGSFGTPLDTGAVGAYAEALEAVRMAPSATNKQPWRLLRDGARWHFYLRRYKHYGKGTPLFTVLRIADLQRVDLGIAMSHFELVARERGLGGSWAVRDPGIPLPGRDAEYVATWVATG